MQQPGVPGDPFGSADPKRRRLFASSGRPAAPPAAGFGDTRLEAMIAAYHQVVVDRLEEGLRTIQGTAVQLMREVANEVWKAGGAKGEDVQSRILSVLSRDQAIRGLIAHSDERFQALDVRVGRVENSLGQIEDNSREMRDLVVKAAQAIREVMSSPAASGIEDVRRRLATVEKYLGATFERLNERDQALVNSLKKQTREHEAIIRVEAGRVVEALEGQVESGAIAAVDRLVETVQQQVQWVNSRVERHARSLAAAMTAHEAKVLDILERPSTRLDAALEGQVQAIRATSKEVTEELSRSFNERLVKLAHLVRSDTEWTQRQLKQEALTQDERLAALLDERLGRVGEIIAASTRWAVEKLAQGAAVETHRAVQTAMADMLVSIDRRFVRLAEGMDRELTRVQEVVAGQIARSFDEGLAPRIDGAVTRLSAAIDGAGDANRAEFARLLDQRIGSLARLVRADNKVLIDRLTAVEEQDAAKQAIRAVNELAASLPNELAQVIDRRFASFSDLLHRETQTTVEAVVQATDAVARRVDKAAASINDRLEKDLDNVIDRMGDAMDALASGWTR